MNANKSVLPPELFGDIIAFLDRDINTLYSCTLVCRAFYVAATSLLYRCIHVSPPKVGLAWQIVEDTLGRKPFATSRLPSHVGYVQEFSLNGYLTKIRPSRQIPVPIIDKIPGALRMWGNLRVVSLTPERATGPALLNVIEALRDCPSLRAITVNEFALHEDIVSALTEVVGLEEMTLLHPTRAAFLILPDWLDKVQSTLVSLKLLGNCGSLTPYVLRMITPSISNIRILAIGLSYSLTDRDIFDCLSQLSKLQNLCLRYYHQCMALPPTPVLSTLQHLTVLHDPLYYKKNADALSAWIRRISSSSPLEVLETVVSVPDGPRLCFDGLLTHVACRHHNTLREVRMPVAYVRAPTLRTVFSRCTNLQRLTLTVAFSTLQALPAMMGGCANLWAVSLDVCDHPKLVIEKKDALKIIQRVPQLRCITVNGVTWKGAWVAQGEGINTTPVFVVSLVANVARDII